MSIRDLEILTRGCDTISYKQKITQQAGAGEISLESALHQRPRLIVIILLFRIYTLYFKRCPIQVS